MPYQLDDTTWRDVSGLHIAALSPAMSGTYLLYQTGGVALAAAGSGFGAFYFDPADYQITGRTLKVRVVARALVNAVAPAITITGKLAAIATWAGASGARPSVATLGSDIATAAIASPAAGGPARTVGTEVTAPSAGWHTLALTLSGAVPANSYIDYALRMQVRNT